jgi:hypothetical protein
LHRSTPSRSDYYHIGQAVRVIETGGSWETGDPPLAGEP